MVWAKAIVLQGPRLKPNCQMGIVCSRIGKLWVDMVGNNAVEANHCGTLMTRYEALGRRRVERSLKAKCPWMSRGWPGIPEVKENSKWMLQPSRHEERKRRGVENCLKRKCPNRMFE